MHLLTSHLSHRPIPPLHLPMPPLRRSIQTLYCLVPPIPPSGFTTPPFIIRIYHSIIYSTTPSSESTTLTCHPPPLLPPPASHVGLEAVQQVLQLGEVGEELLQLRQEAGRVDVLHRGHPKTKLDVKVPQQRRVRALEPDGNGDRMSDTEQHKIRCVYDIGHVRTRS